MSRLYLKKSGFTLIELLVVIAIIALLAAILFPVFARARENARKSSCLNNVKQVGLAWTQYFQDFDERFPQTVTERQATDATRFGAVADTAAARAEYSYRVKLQPYIKSVQVFKCPSGPAWDAPAATKWYTVDYGYHLNEGNFSAGFGQQAWYAANPDFGTNETHTLADIGKTASFILGAEAGRSDNTPSRGGLFPLQYIAPADTTQARLLERHLGYANVFFADGHAKNVMWVQTWTDINRNWWRRNPS